jgi:LmbE family N-acetylglucosaminyl deacetylase
MLFSSAIIFAAHPDDEIVMAGTMAKMAAEGTRVVVVQMTDGSEGYPEAAMKDRIVELRRKEADACNEALGVAQRYLLGRPDMALVNDKATLQEVIAIVRKERPQAAFHQGDVSLHRDHINTYQISLEAVWHAGEPVAVALGEPWRTPEVYLYKDARTDQPPFPVGVRGYGHKFFEALATQESQFTLFKQHFGLGSREEFRHAIDRMKETGGRDIEFFWIAREALRLSELPDPADHHLRDWALPTSG